MTSWGGGCCWTFFSSVFFSIFNFENFLLVSCVPYFYSSWDASRHVTKLVVRVVSASSSVWSAPNHGFVLFCFRACVVADLLNQRRSNVGGKKKKKHEQIFFVAKMLQETLILLRRGFACLWSLSDLVCTRWMCDTLRTWESLASPENVDPVICKFSRDAHPYDFFMLSEK